MWSTGWPRRSRSSRPARYASITAACASRPNSSVTLTLIPSAVARRIASTPAGVAGILIIAFGRSTRAQSSRAAATVALGVVGERGRHLEADEPVDRRQHVGGGLDVLDRERLVERARVAGPASAAMRSRVALARPSTRRAEDRRVRGQAGHRVLAHEALELGRRHEAVDPDAGAKRRRGGTAEFIAARSFEASRRARSPRRRARRARPRPCVPRRGGHMRPCGRVRRRSAARRRSWRRRGRRRRA